MPTDTPARADASKPRSGASREELGLVERLQAREESAFLELVGRYHGRRRRLARIFRASTDLIQRWPASFQPAPAAYANERRTSWADPAASPASPASAAALPMPSAALSTLGRVTSC